MGRVQRLAQSTGRGVKSLVTLLRSKPASHAHSQPPDPSLSMQSDLGPLDVTTTPDSTTLQAAEIPSKTEPPLQNGDPHDPYLEADDDYV